MEILLQGALQELAELTAIVFILSCYTWQFAIWGAAIFG